MRATWALEEDGDGIHRLVLHGDLDLAAEGSLFEFVSTKLDEGSVERLILDLGDVHFIDSGGLRALVRLHQAYGDRTKVGTTSPVVRRLFELTRLTGRLGDDADP
ncbi:MAG: STAS domain-containing protein [Ilumatobacteraceae bacterium]